MKITDVDIIPIHPRLANRYEGLEARLVSITDRTVFRVRTDNGLVGYGDLRCTPPPASSVEPLIGHNPFDFINNRLNAGLGGALYDVMGKYLEVPAYKLMGQKMRDAVTVAAWTRPAPPADFRNEIARAAAQGYTVFKMHTCEYYDVMEQTRAAEEVAPDGFKIHYDLNGGWLNSRGNRTLGAVLPIILELQKSRVVGFIEDPLQWTDIDGWRRLREKVEVPLIRHVAPLGGLQEIIHGVADMYMIGDGSPEPSVGDTLARGTACGLANIPTVIQLTGGTLTKALALHMAAVLPTAPSHSTNLDDQYEDDITTERIPVIEGFSPVPEGPGLGIAVDEDELDRLAAQKPSAIRRHVGILRLPGGHKIYTASFPDVSRLIGREEGTLRGIDFDLWEDDGTPEFKRAYERVQAEESFLE